MKRIALLLIFAIGASLAVAGSADARRATRLRAFGSCGQLVRYGVRHAPPPVVVPRGPVPVPMPVAGGGEGGGGNQDAASGGGAPAAAEGEGTNVQEPGVDEPDIIKSNGQTLFAIQDGKLHAIEATGGAPRLLDTLDLPNGDAQMLLHGSRLLVTIGRYTSGTVLEEIDVSEPAHLRLSRSLTVDGSLLSSRMHDGTARVVLGERPRALIDIGVPVAIDGVGTATAAARTRVSRKASRWLPQGRFRSRISGRRWTRKLVGCHAVRHPSSFSGLDMLTVLTIDLDKGLWATDRDAILSDAETVYASADSLYVATQQMSEAGNPGDTTSIHRFDASTPRATSYAGSGAVPGALLNQFSLSEQGNVLRAATTANDSSESRVITLETRGGKLSEIGRVGGLGRGERIYAVRFIGDLGYVVTFRQVDPLYVVDLSDPAHPAVRGELKIPGFSAYLHPIGDDLIVGVGQDATDTGRRRGVQVSLFDVADPAHPARLAQQKLGGQYSESPVEYDHHAFLWWPQGGLAVLPVTDYGNDYDAPSFAGTRAVHIGRAGITDVGSIPAPALPSGERAVQERAVIVDGALWTVSAAGAGRADPATLAPTAWVPFG